MAQLSYADLVRAVSEHPEAAKWEMGVAPAISTYIAFASGERVESETLEAANGTLIVVDRNDDGLVCGIEIS